MFKKLKKIVLLLALSYLILFFFDIDDTLYSKIINYYNKIKGEQSLLLEEYRVSINAKKINQIKDNLSDITYNNKTKTLFAIQNRPRKIYELSLSGDILRTIELFGFKDTEGITYIKDNDFAIVDERLQTVFICSINNNTKKIKRKDIIRKLKLNNDSFKNFGYEGIAYNGKTDEFYIINEKFPIQVITVSNWINNNNLSISFENKLSSITNYVGDLSGIYYNKQFNHVMFLSDESFLLTESNLKGERVSFMDLEEGFVGLDHEVPQAEGITMDENNNIYIVSEPNLFYKFTKN